MTDTKHTPTPWTETVAYAMFSCQNSMCAEECSYHENMLRWFNGEPLCENFRVEELGSGCYELPAFEPITQACNAYEDNQATIERLAEALEIIAGKRQCPDNLMGNVDIAQATLKKEGDLIMSYEKLTCKIYASGDTYYYDADGKLHHPNGHAIWCADGGKNYYIHGERHRKDGPAIELASGEKYYYIHDKLHREDGPAIEYADGEKHYYIHGERHRKDGPAIELASGAKYYFLNGKKLTEIEWKDALNPVKEMTMAEIAKALGHEVKVVE